MGTIKWHRGHRGLLTLRCSCDEGDSALESSHSLFRPLPLDKPLTCCMHMYVCTEMLDEKNLLADLFADGESRLQTRSANERAAQDGQQWSVSNFLPRGSHKSAPLFYAALFSDPKHRTALCYAFHPSQWNHNSLSSMFARVWPEASENQAWTFSIFQKRS